MSRRILTALTLAVPLSSQALCTSDQVRQPAAVLERFISADCLACWSDRATPVPGKDTVVLDWIIPGAQGENAPLSAVASSDARERLRALKQPAPQRSASVTSRRQGSAVPLRIAQGESFNDYVGTSIELKPPAGDSWQAWLVLVERLPAGVEGSPVPRNLVRNVFRADWNRAAGKLGETRAMQIHEGASPQRLRLVALLQDGRGRIRAITQTECP